jgi:hypothetical protein
VWFGERWITSVFDQFEENVRYFPALLPVCDDEDPAAVLARGDTPELAELRMHNGTIYRWNRPVYDVFRGRPHLRVENRVLPAGPSVVDVLANGAFYYGLLRALVEQDRPLWSQMSFPAAFDNFEAGAQRGIDAHLFWPGFGEVPATELVLRRLLPLAHEGLAAWGVDAAVTDRLLGVIERRCTTGRTARNGKRGCSTASTSGASRSTVGIHCARCCTATSSSCIQTSRSTPGHSTERPDSVARTESRATRSSDAYDDARVGPASAATPRRSRPTIAQCWSCCAAAVASIRASPRPASASSRCRSPFRCACRQRHDETVGSHCLRR